MFTYYTAVVLAAVAIAATHPSFALARDGGRSSALLPAERIRKLGSRAITSARSITLKDEVGTRRKLNGGDGENSTDPYGDLGNNFTDFFEDMGNFTDMFGDLGNFTDMFGDLGNFTDMFGDLGNFTYLPGDLGNFTDLFGGLGNFTDLLGNPGTFMNSMVPEMCMQFQSPEFLANMTAEEDGISCSQFGCDESDPPNLIMECSIAEEFCDDDHDFHDGQQDRARRGLLRRRLEGHEEEEEKFCVEDTTVNMKVELDFSEVSVMSSTQCSNYTSPDYLASKGRACWSIQVSTDYGKLYGDLMNMENIFGSIDWNSTDAEVDDSAANEMAMEYISIDECSAEFTDGTECTCGTCNDGAGFEITCEPDGSLISEECTPFDGSGTAGVYEDDSVDDDMGIIPTPVVTVVRLIENPAAGNVVVQSDADEGDDADTDADADTDTDTEPETDADTEIDTEPEADEGASDAPDVEVLSADTEADPASGAARTTGVMMAGVGLLMGLAYVPVLM